MSATLWTAKPAQIRNSFQQDQIRQIIIYKSNDFEAVTSDTQHI